MKYRAILLLAIIFINNQVFSGTRILHGEGVLVNLDKSKGEGFYGIDFGQGLNVLNTDNSIYGTFHSDHDSHEFYFVRGDIRARPKVRAYYPDYHILIMDVKKTGENEYILYIDGGWKKIRTKSRLSYKTWHEFIQLDVGFIAYKETPLIMYEKKSGSNSIKLKSTENYSFSIKKVDGDWVYAVCDLDCEGCGELGKKIEGWFRWKKDMRLLIDLRYIC